MPDPRPIEKRKQLVVEGRDAEEFFSALLREMGLEGEIQVQNFGGISELANFLKAVRIAPGSDGSLVPELVSLGIVRDAERKHPENAFKSACSALRGAGFAVPSQMETFEGDIPRVGVLILPDADTKGMLEDLCLRSVENHPVKQCIDQYFGCVKQQLGSLPRNMAKARVQAFLAAMREQVTHLGVAAHKGYWPLSDHVFDHAREFLSNM